MPRAHFVEEVVVEEDLSNIVQRLGSGSIDLANQALISERLDLAPAPIDSSSTVTASLTHFDARRIEYDVNTDAPRLLAMAEVYYPAGWKAFIDDAEVPIIRTNYLQRGVVVPAGSHTVRFEFNPRSHSLGILLSGLSSAFAFLVLLYLGFRQWQARQRETVSSIDPTLD
jgi:hypothetical protein